MKTVDSETPPEEFDAEKRAVVIVLVVALLVAAAFLLRFAASPVASTSDKWGELGDYIGGLLNPVVALAALFLLARSVRIQKTELSATRKALADQVDEAKDSADLAALSSLIDSALAEVSIHRDYLQFLVAQIGAQDQIARQHELEVQRQGGRGRMSPDRLYAIHSIEGAAMTREKAIEEIARVNKVITDRMYERNGFEGRIREIMARRTKDT